MRWRIRFCIASVLLGTGLVVQASGLSTTFADIVVERAEVGKKIEVHGPEGKGLLVKNLGDSPVQVSIQARAPMPSQFRPGAVALPNLAWVSFDKPTILIPAQGVKEFKVWLNIPRQKEYRNHTYQVMLWSTAETARTDGISYNAGLYSCLRIHTLP